MKVWRIGIIGFVASAACAYAWAGPEGMAWIPGGDFQMGTNDANSMANERPAHPVHVNGFWMDETPVTNAQFKKFIDATGYKTTAERPIDWEQMKTQVPPGTPKPPDEALNPGSLVFVPPNGPMDLNDLSAWWRWTPGASWQHPEGPSSDLKGRENEPAVQVSWDDAVAYAKWAGKRLPTEAEWEFAAHGGTTTRYFWGDKFDPKKANTFTGTFPYRNTATDGYVGRSPVKAFPPNGYGLYDMAGNVWNWCSDVYRADTHAKLAETKGCCLNPKGPASTFDPTRPVGESLERVIKGGSYLCNEAYCESYRPTARRGTPPDTATEHVGFRCVSDAPHE